MRIPNIVLAATIAAGGLTLVTAGPAGAWSDSEAATMLDELCEQRGGTPVNSPYALARCQEARANKGFDAERLICEELADGELLVTVGTYRMNRASWACVATSPIA
jgi:hypothetical protein